MERWVWPNAAINRAKTAADRFLARVDRSGGADKCWLWTAYRNEQGYGRFRVNGKKTLAHRFAYELAYGPISDGLNVLHRCDNPSCVRPDHLFLGTHQDNSDDKIAKGRDRHALGERQHLARLTEEGVREIRRRYAGRHGEIAALAREFGVDRTCVSRVVRGKTWGHIA